MPAHPPPPAAGAPMRPPAPADESRAAVVREAEAAASQALSKPVRLAVKRYAHQDRWAFVLGAMQDQHGGALDLAGTPKAEAAAQGLVSRDYAALLSHSAAGWSVVASAVGPTDVAWAGWASTYGAPPAILADH